LIRPVHRQLTALFNRTDKPRSNTMQNPKVEAFIQDALKLNPELTEGDIVEIRSVLEHMPEFTEETPPD
jgi:hypothetical protein